MEVSMWKVSTFGRDCIGNITGYRVERRRWRYTGNPYRKDGMNLSHEIAGQFVGNIYEAGSFDRAKAKADTLAAKLNSVGFPPILSHAIH
jgi:hypothetical protein